MGAFAAGHVVVLPFPFSDLTRNKFRPALLLAEVGRGDWIACQITSNAFADVRAMTLGQADFVSGGLQRQSYVRPGKLFTASETLGTWIPLRSIQATRNRSGEYFHTLSSGVTRYPSQGPERIALTTDEHFQQAGFRALLRGNRLAEAATSGRDSSPCPLKPNTAILTPHASQPMSRTC